MKISIHCLLAAFALTAARAAASLENFGATTEVVGRNPNGLVTSVNQLVTPAGTLVELPNMRPLALALSPDGKRLVTAGLTHELVVVDPATGKILQHVPLPSDTAQEPAPVSTEIISPDGKAQISFTGLVFSPDGSRIYMANVNGDIKVFTVQPDHKIAPLFSIPLPPANRPGHINEIPAGIAVSPDGKKIYVALNLSNRLAELDAATGRVLRMWDVGVAPFDVKLAGHRIYVSNWGGRRPDANSATGPAGRGTLVRVDSRSIASEGSVSIIELNTNIEHRTSNIELRTGLHAGALALSPGGRWLVVANAGSDTLNVIDTHTDQIVETICARQNPGDLFGAQPNALAFDKSGKTLFVCNGTQNAVAVFQFKPGASKLLGLIPVGWFPGAIVQDGKRHAIYVANIKNLGPGRLGKTGQTEFNTKQYHGSLSLVPVPSAKELAAFTQTALANLRYPLLAQAKLPARENRSAQPVPERVGEPGVFQHVIYIIKENRSYDQILGDVQEGNGDAGLCTFGARVTPNQHKLVREFALLDNTYCCGILSADWPQLDRQRHRERLCGAFVRRLAAQLSQRRQRPGHGGRAGLFAGGFHLERRARTRPDGLRLRRVHLRQKTMEGPCAQRQTGLPRLLPRLYKRRGRNRVDGRTGHRGVAALHRDEHGWLGSGCAGCFPRRAIYQGTEAIRTNGQFPQSRHPLAAQRSHQRNEIRFAQARSAGGGQRSCVRTNCRSRQPQPVLDEHVHFCNRR